MRHRTFRRLAVLGIVVAGLTLPTGRSPSIGIHAGTASADRSPFLSEMPAIAPQDIKITPGGCTGVTPPGEPPPACCISGFVYADGQPVAGAEVEIHGPHGFELKGSTVVYTDTAIPYYAMSLNVSPGETITITARYSGHQRTLLHTMHPGGQHVDVVLARNQPDDYLYERQIGTPTATFSSPYDIAVDGAGNLYVVDNGNARVQVFDSTGQFVRQWGTLGSGPGQFNNPGGVAIDPGGNLYIADKNNHRIQHFSPLGTPLGTLGTFGSDAGQFSSPAGVTVDANGNVYVADTGNNRIQKFRSDGIWLASWGSFGSGTGQFDMPIDVATDGVANIYVLDRNNQRVQIFTSGGAPLASWGSQGSANGQFSDPQSLTADVSGNIYVADNGNKRVQKFSGAGGWLASWGGIGFSDGMFGSVYGITVSGSGRVYVADSTDNRIQIFHPMTAAQPISTIVHLSSLTLAPGEILAVYGQGQDSDTSTAISTYRWSSDKQGVIADTATFTRTTGVPGFGRLKPGVHKLTLQVKDDQGQSSEPATIDIRVEGDPWFEIFLPQIAR
jgi:streptogramin lyase